MRLLFISLLFFPVLLQADELSIKELAKLSLEELMSLDVVVTSAAKKPQKLANAATAIAVITNEDISRSGATTLAEALRLVPGVQVARITAHKWAVSIRGFNSQFASKLQVLIDGRSIYSHLTANVIWDIHNPLLEDIERIEVIRGPGASLWGANAMNGVINITTKHSQDTQGNLVVGGVGNEEKLFGAFRHGGRFNEDSYYKLYGKSFEHDDGGSFNGEKTSDLSRGFQGGFRTDIKISGQDTFTLQGDYFEGQEEEYLSSELIPKQPFESKPIQYNVLGRWLHKGYENDELALQFYFNREDWVNSEDATAFPDFYIDTYDVDFQHRFTAFDRNEISWGLGYRLIVDSYSESLLASFNPRQKKIPLYSGFIQNEINLIEGFWRLIIGSKFEHNDFTGFEIQPTIRSILTWDDHALWAAISRSTRTPSRSEDGSVSFSAIPNDSSPVIVKFLNANELKSEQLISYEIGYRFKANEHLNFDFAAYYNDYDRLVDINSLTPTQQSINVDTAYIGKASVLGFEAAMDWRPIDSLAVKFSYTYLDDQSSVTLVTSNAETSPHHQAMLFASYSISPYWEFSFSTRFVDEIDFYNIDSYVGIDSRVAFKPIQGLEIALIGQNLFDNHHPEFGESTVETTPTEVERSLYAKVSWEF